MRQRRNIGWQNEWLGDLETSGFTIPTSWYILRVEMAANQSKERILAGAKELFLARGYAATTVDAICEKAELTKGSFYYFFDSKEDLGLAVLDWSLQRSAQMLEDGPHAGILDPLEKAFAFLEHLEKCSPELWSGGCLLGSFSMELADTNSRVQQVVAGMFQALTDDFTLKLQPIADQCAGQQGSEARGFADTLLSIVEGSIILAKAHRDPTRIPKAIRGFRLSLATLIAIPGSDGRTRSGKPTVKPSKSISGTRTRILSVENGAKK